MKTFRASLLALLALAAACGNPPANRDDGQAPADSLAETRGPDNGKPSAPAAQPSDGPQVITESGIKRMPNGQIWLPTLHPGNAEALLLEFGEMVTTDEVLIKTHLGNIRVRLYRDTPLHRANFLYLAQRGFYDLTEFYRIKRGFVVQGGGGGDELTEITQKVVGSYTLAREMHTHHYHKRGALSMTRAYNGNPEKRSSAFDFFIIDGSPVPQFRLDSIPQRDKSQAYKQLGGSPHLDWQHTVFGEVVEGLDVVDALARLATDSRDWPLESCLIKMELVEPTGL